MTQGVLPFDNHTSKKLQYAAFPTLRKEDKHGDVGDINTITHGTKGNRSELGEAKIIAKEQITLEDERLTSSFLCFDTESENWDEAYNVLCDCYGEAIEPDEELTLYWNVWTERYE